jgi:hypothetical protein
MSILPRDLADLQNHYQSLVEGVSAGSLSYEDAIEALSHIAATDAVGVVWRLDINGNFLAGAVGVEPLLTDPQRFVERTSPGPWNSTTSNISGQQGGGLYGDVQSTMQTNDYQNQSGYGSGQVNDKQYTPNPYGTPGKQNTNPNQSGIDAKPKKRLVRLPAVPNFNGGVVESLKRYRTVIVVGVAIAGAVFIWSGTSPSTPTTALPIAEPTTPPQMNSSQEGSQVTNEDDTQSRSREDLLDLTNSMLAQLGTGTADAAPTVVSDPGNGNKALLRRAQFSGYVNVGLSVKAVSLASSTASTATVRVSLVNAAGEVLAKGTVDIIKGESGWSLKSWPVLG